ncbi:fluoride efflux transporter CrcB [Kribbella catacumbae]|uniref:fluoride efflux transporter CrcB n=1 Tax=Kribbella catacumbae TaxID=460086 RepID=UPI00035F0488|nr:fluoride efflux transporter CrcB [Kribbella catacumbae]
MQSDPSPREPIDPDVDLRHPTTRVETSAAASGRGGAVVLLAIAGGGAVGASARYLIGLGWPAPAGSLPWATMVINLVGCALIGVLMVLVSEVWVGQRLLRPFLGTGVLGGFTTFSTYAVDLQQLIADRHPITAVTYLLATVIGAIAAVWAATHATRALVRRRRNRRDRR